MGLLPHRGNCKVTLFLCVAQSWSIIDFQATSLVAFLGHLFAVGALVKELRRKKEEEEVVASTV